MCPQHGRKQSGGVKTPPAPRVLEAVKNSLFILPAVTLFAMFSLYPMGRTIILSLTDWNGLTNAVHYIGFQNFLEALSGNTSHVFWRGVRNALLYAMVGLTITNGLSLLLAVAIDNPHVRGRAWYRAIYYVPPIVSPVVVGVMWKWIYHPYSGVINTVLRNMGLGHLARAWLAIPEIAVWAVAVSTIWQGVGGPFLLYLAGLQSIPQEVQESAAIDGANNRQRLWRITLPLLAPVAVRVTILTITGAFLIFGTALVMTGGGPGYATEVPMLTIYRTAFDFMRFGYATALSVILSLMLLVLALVQSRLAKRFGGDG